MIRSVGFTALLSIVFALSTPGVRAQGAMGSEADKAAIKQAVATWEDAWNRHDARATAMCYAEDGDFYNLTGVNSHGWKELEDHYNTIFTTFLRSAHRTDTVKGIRFLTPDMASVDIDFQVTSTPDGPPVAHPRGWLTWIMTKHDGKWLITIYHEAAF
jgi:uncharacterized protein (TIGR02246 family)